MILLNPAANRHLLILPVEATFKRILTRSVKIEEDDPKDDRREQQRCGSIGRHVANIAPNLVQIDILGAVEEHHRYAKHNSTETVQLFP